MAIYLRKNFATGILKTGIGSGDLSMELTAGETLPHTVGKQMLLLWDYVVYPDPMLDANAEFVEAEWSSGHIFTIARAKEGTVARSHSATTTKVAMFYTAGLSTSDLSVLVSAEVPALDSGFLVCNGSEWSFDGNTYAISTHNHTGTYQPVDADLTALAALATTGIMVKTASATYSTITDGSTNWNTAYADRMKWNGGSTGLNASTGRTSLGLGTAALAATGDFLAAGATAVNSDLLDGQPSSYYQVATNRVYNKRTEIDFGTLPVNEATFTIVDANITIDSNIIGQISFETPTGKETDELEFDSFDFRFKSEAGYCTLYIKSLEGLVADKFKINYSYNTV